MPSQESIQPLGMWAAAPLQLVRIAVVGVTTPGRGLQGLRQCIKEEQVRTHTLKSSGTPKTDPETWPVARSTDTTGLGYSFLVKQTAQAAHQTVDGMVFKIPALAP